MAEENKNVVDTPTTDEIEINDRGVFDFLGKKKEQDHQKPQGKEEEEVILTEFDNVKVSNEEEKKNHSLLGKFHQSNSSSSSVSFFFSTHATLFLINWWSDQYLIDCTYLIKKCIERCLQSIDEEEEEVGEDGEKKKKKENKGLKEKIQEKMGGEKKHDDVDTSVPVEKVEVHHPAVAVTHHEAESTEEKKGFLDKIKEKLPGQHKKTDQQGDQVPLSSSSGAGHETETATEAEGEAKENKKGLLDKIKEKLPGYHSKPTEDKEKETPGTAHWRWSDHQSLFCFVRIGGFVLL